MYETLKDYLGNPYGKRLIELFSKDNKITIEDKGTSEIFTITKISETDVLITSEKDGRNLTANRFKIKIEIPKGKGDTVYESISFYQDSLKKIVIKLK